MQQCNYDISNDDNDDGDDDDNDCGTVFSSMFVFFWSMKY